MKLPLILALALAATFNASANGPSAPRDLAASDGFFRAAPKAGELCSFAVSWGRGLLNNIVVSSPSAASCQPEMRAAADAYAKSPPLLWWNVIERPPEGGLNGDCVMALTWSQGSPAQATPTFATRLGGLNGPPLPTQPGCVADSHGLAGFIVATRL